MTNMTTKEKYPIGTIVIISDERYGVVRYDDEYAYLYSTIISYRDGQPIKKGKIKIEKLENYKIYDPFKQH